jgi:hypothetical protein
MNKDFSKLCTPAKIYFIIAVISSVIALIGGVRLIPVAIKLVFAAIWTCVLGWLCKKGFTSISWFLVLLPYIIIVLAMVGIYHVTHEQKQIMRALKIQGAYGQEPFVAPGRRAVANA